MAKHIHERCGLTFAELGALLATREMLKLGQLTHVKCSTNAYSSWDEYAATLGNTHGFNMEITCKTNGECGSVGCIGGTMAQIMGLKGDAANLFVDDQGHRPNLHRLFYPHRASDSPKFARVPRYTDITPRKAVKAIDNFLFKYGDPRWDLVYPLKVARKRGPRKVSRRLSAAKQMQVIKKRRK